VADQVILVQPVHAKDDAATSLVVEASNQRVVEPFVDRLAARIVRRAALGCVGAALHSRFAAGLGAGGVPRSPLRRHDEVGPPGL